MENVIAEYKDLSAAELAVRSLEQRGMSIQNFSISDQAQRVWRRSNPPWERRPRGQVARRAFLVGVAVAFIGVQVGLSTSFMPASEPMSSALTWALVCGTCLLAGCLGAALTFTLRPAGQG
jgi:hypothetical protein